MLVSAVLLFTEGEDGTPHLEVATSRRMASTDTRIELPGKRGVIGLAIDEGASRLTQTPSMDPELGFFVALQSCNSAYCIPLRIDFDTYGLLLFAHPESEFFKPMHREILDIVGLGARRKDLVRTFSRGMQQRLAIGRAILHDPEVLLLDEPHTGLDQDACDMLDTVLRQVAVRGRTVVMTSHDIARVEDLASRFDILVRGQIQASTQRASIQQDGLLSFYRKGLLITDNGGSATGGSN